MDLGTDADELALALELGLASVEEAISWADAAIITLDPPPYAVIEVSSASRAPRDEVAHLLRAVPGARDSQVVIQRVLKRIALAVHDGQTSPAFAARLLYEMYLSGYSPGPDAEAEMSRLDDAFSLAAEGVYGTAEEATKDLYTFLNPYLPRN